MVDREVAGFQVEPDTAEVSGVRTFTRQELQGSVPEHLIPDLQLVVSELVTNAIEHGADHPVVVLVRRDADRVAISVRSRGPSTGVGPVEDWEVAAADAISGRGLGIVRRLADAVDVEQDETELIVTVHRRFNGDES